MLKNFHKHYSRSVLRSNLLKRFIPKNSLISYEENPNKSQQQAQHVGIRSSQMFHSFISLWAIFHTKRIRKSERNVLPLFR